MLKYKDFEVVKRNDIAWFSDNAIILKKKEWNY